MSHRESYRVITIIRVNCPSNVVICLYLSVWGKAGDGAGIKHILNEMDDHSDWTVRNSLSYMC